MPNYPYPYPYLIELRLESILTMLSCYLTQLSPHSCYIQSSSGLGASYTLLPTHHKHALGTNSCTYPTIYQFPSELQWAHHVPENMPFNNHILTGLDAPKLCHISKKFLLLQSQRPYHSLVIVKTTVPNCSWVLCFHFTHRNGIVDPWTFRKFVTIHAQF
jgi:hypothetical protein